ncbi:MAG: prenyltransferase [Candidatus Omnitrophica bacterium]|nr:prenyltransferase [Candidatus Omnitrophota bacterium]
MITYARRYGFSGLIKNLITALRLPFISVSQIAFLFGSLISWPQFNPGYFILGSGIVIFTHLGANLFNDYADSLSGVDWQDTNAYGFFGGSKLIQQKIFSERFYLVTAVCFFSLALAGVLFLSVLMKSFIVLGSFLFVCVIGAGYSLGPLEFSYKRIGELVIFLLFGPALVMGGYFIQTGVFPSWEGFYLSLPLGFAAIAVLFANEIPDFPHDLAKNKLNWVSFWGQEKAFIGYYFIIACIFCSVVFNVIAGNLRVWTLSCFLGIVPVLKAGRILKYFYADKQKCRDSSKLTIGVYIYSGIILIMDKLI